MDNEVANSIGNNTMIFYCDTYNACIVSIRRETGVCIILRQLAVNISNPQLLYLETSMN